jgi:hypothetical protein
MLLDVAVVPRGHGAAARQNRERQAATPQIKEWQAQGAFFFSSPLELWPFVISAPSHRAITQLVFLFSCSSNVGRRFVE